MKALATGAIFLRTESVSVRCARARQATQDESVCQQSEGSYVKNELPPFMI